MRWLLVTIVAMAGCSSLSSPSMQQCEAFVQAKLRSPSTYKLISASEIAMNGGKEYWVSIEYDAANAYGTPIREKFTCKYPAVNGQPDVSNYIDFDEIYEKEVDNMLETSSLNL